MPEIKTLRIPVDTPTKVKYNLADFSEIGRVPFQLLLQPGETLETEQGAKGRIDDVWMCIWFYSKERAEVVTDALQAIAQRKIGRKLRTK